MASRVVIQVQGNPPILAVVVQDSSEATSTTTSIRKIGVPSTAGYPQASTMIPETLQSLAEAMEALHTTQSHGCEHAMVLEDLEIPDRRNY